MARHLGEDMLELAGTSRITLVLTFVLVLVLTTASRFASFKYIQTLDKGGIGEINLISE